MDAQRDDGGTRQELAVYFYLSVDEAAEKLGMCM
jgi:hypothetical protein